MSAAWSSPRLIGKSARHAARAAGRSRRRLDGVRRDAAACRASRAAPRTSAPRRPRRHRVARRLALLGDAGADEDDLDARRRGCRRMQRAPWRPSARRSAPASRPGPGGTARRSRRWPGRSWRCSALSRRPGQQLAGTRAATRSAPKATSCHRSKPSRAACPRRACGPSSANSAGKARGDARGDRSRRRPAAPRRRSMPRSTCLACWLQTRTQLPQPMQRSGDDLGLAVGDADRLGRALPHARVAHAAAFLDRGHERLVVVASHCRFPPVGRRPSGSPLR